MSQGCIGVFDSGVGGLSVLTALSKAYPNDSFVYLGDTARLPYGTKSPETIKRYVTRNVDFLCTHYSIKAIVIACNSASTVLDDLSLPVKTYGVIEAGSRAALKKSKNKNIALWATRATTDSHAYEKALTALDPKVEVSSQACSTLVTLVEEDISSHPLLGPAFDFYLSELFKKNNKVDTLILGCTHFPFFKEELSKHLKTLSYNITLVDASDEIIADLSTLSKKKSPPSKNKVLITDDAPHFKTFIKKVMPKDWDYSLEKVDI